MNIRLLLPFLFFGSFYGYAETRDSLWGVWENTTLHDTLRLEAIRKFIWDEYLYDDQDSARYFNQLNLELAKKSPYKKHLASAYNIEGTIFYFLAEYDSAIYYMERASTINFAVENYTGSATNRANIATIYSAIGRYDQAIQLSFESLKIFEKMDQDQDVAIMLNHIGNLYYTLEDFDQALIYLRKSLEMKRELKDNFQIVSSLINLGQTYVKIDESEQAGAHFQEAFDLARSIGDESGEAEVLSCLAQYNKDLGNTDLALEQHLEALTYFDQQQFENRKAKECLFISEIYAEQDALDQAKYYANEAYTIGEAIGSPRILKDAADQRYQLNKATQNPAEALAMIELRLRLEDSLQKDENLKSIIKESYQYEYEKQALIDSLDFAAQAAVQNEQLKQQKTQLYGLSVGLGLLLFVAVILFRNYRQKKRDNEIIQSQKREVEKQRDISENQRKEIDLQHQALRDSHQEIQDSIRYAQHLQGAILPSTDEIQSHLEDFFILFQPKDVVSGDFYWFEAIDSETKLIAVADCTGHGVPGALVSVVCSNALNRSVKEFGLTQPAEILNKTRELVIETFAKSGGTVRDGMDIAFCALHSGKLIFSGANNPLWIYRSGEGGMFEEIRGNRQPIGKYENAVAFEQTEVLVSSGDAIYFFSDGFVDQFGGKDGKKFKKKQLRALLQKMKDQDMIAQRKGLLEAFNTWKEGYDQIDDVCMIGIRC